MKLFNFRKSIFTLLLLILPITLAACGNSNSSAISDTGSGLGNNNEAYPALYIEAGLPQYANATIISKREGRNLNDGVQVTLETADSVALVKAFFDTEMSNRGFALPSGVNLVNDSAYYARYTNSGKNLSLTVTKLSESTPNRILIIYSEQ